MFKKIKLSIKFELKVVEINVYLRNHLFINFLINENFITLIKIFMKMKFFIHYIRV